MTPFMGLICFNILSIIWEGAFGGIRQFLVFDPYESVGAELVLEVDGVVEGEGAQVHIHFHFGILEEDLAVLNLQA